jgi:predicted nucleic acid-binding protein
MWAAAKIHQLDAIFTEDMNVGSLIEGVSIVNPLTDSFDLQTWLSAE